MDRALLFSLIFSLVTLFALVSALVLWGVLRLLFVRDATFGRCLVMVAAIGAVNALIQGAFYAFTADMAGQLLVFAGMFFVFYFVLTRYHQLSWSAVFGAYLAFTFSALSILLLVLLPLRTVVMPVVVSGESMSPSYHDGDYLLMSTVGLPYDRGDVVIFRNPLREDQYLIKRIVGLPGETVLVADGKVSINGAVLSEAYLPQSFETNGWLFVSLSQGEYVVLGDNRQNALDSRGFGPVSQGHIIGEVIYPKFR